MTRDVWTAVRRHRVTLAAAAAIIVMTAWPASIVPLGQGYIAFCARFLSATAVGHRVPPYLAALLIPLTMTLTGGVTLALARQISGQRRLDAALLSQRCALRPARQAIVARLGLAGRVICARDARAFAFCGRLVAPRIYLSSGLDAALTDAEFAAVLLHERRHLRRRDPLRFFVADLARPFAPLVPVIALAVERLQIRAELAADRDALAEAPVEVLASALIKALGFPSATEPGARVASLSPTDARVAVLLGRPIDLTLKRGDLLISAGFIVGLATALLVLATRSAPLPMICEPCTFF